MYCRFHLHAIVKTNIWLQLQVLCGIVVAGCVPICAPPRDISPNEWDADSFFYSSPANCSSNNSGRGNNRWWWFRDAFSSAKSHGLRAKTREFHGTPGRPLRQAHPSYRLESRGYRVRDCPRAIGEKAQIQLPAY